MVIGKFWNGSGLGNMLHRYIATRIRAKELGVDYGMVYIDDGAGKEPGFKGKFFLNQPNLVEYPAGYKEWHEKKVLENGTDIRGYDPEFNFVQDNTLIDGEFQDERYFEHRINDVNKWLETEYMEVPDNVCVIGFRGGEYMTVADLFLPKEYWDEAIEMMKMKIPNVQFQVHTDDPKLAKQCFPDYEVIHDIGINWRSMRYARHAIIANSSFYILPRLLNGGITIAPRYWARHNTGVWALSQNYYKSFMYI